MISRSLGGDSFLEVREPRLVQSLSQDSHWYVLLLQRFFYVPAG